MYEELPLKSNSFERTKSYRSRFIDRKHYPKPKELRKELLESFDIPDILATDACTDLNGYFGSRSHYDEDGHLKTYSTVVLNIHQISILC